MKLKDVRSYGTEGRRNGVNEVDPSDQEHPVVIFKVDHIKDFKIIKKRDEPAKQTFQEQDPAIISAQVSNKVEKKETPKEETNKEQKEHHKEPVAKEEHK